MDAGLHEGRSNVLRERRALRSGGFGKATANLTIGRIFLKKMIFKLKILGILN